jgi:hypothetical protein
MRKASLRLILFLAALLLLPSALFAQKKESLAVFPFTGGNISDGEAIASSLSRQLTLRNAFNSTTLITQSTIAAMNFEQRFQRNGLTDADTIFELGKALNASHVIAGYITRLGNNNLVLVSIMDIENLQQIAGDYRAYRTIEEIDKLIPDIAQILANAIVRNTSGLPGLSVPPFNILTGVNQNDAMVLAQILACDLANGNTFAVLPRTDNIDKVLEEHRRQRSGITDQNRVKLLGAGRNAQYVLSGSIQRLGTLNKFAADILDIVGGNSIYGYEETYSDLSQGFELMPKLAGQLMWGTSYERIKAARAGNYAITLTKDVQINTEINFSGFENKIITIKGDSWGRSITFANTSSFSIPNNVVLILENINLKGNTLEARGSVVRVNQGGKLEMRNGTAITNNGSFSGGGGVSVNGGTFTMNGGTIRDNVSNGYFGGAGGGVFVDGGTFIMNGGYISDNTANGTNGGWGGGVVLFDGTFIMNGGTIDGNAGTDGGGVYVKGGTFTMNDGIIGGNTANTYYETGNSHESGGGGVAITGGTFRMNNGTIVGNTADHGGGVAIVGATFWMQDGIIIGNTAQYYGGGVYVGDKGRLIKNGGLITSTNNARDGKIVGGKVRRNREAAGESVNLDSDISGRRGGWE